jgi:hypothetical protein
MKTLKDRYQTKLVGAEEAVKVVKSGDWIFFPMLAVSRGSCPEN